MQHPKKIHFTDLVHASNGEIIDRVVDPKFINEYKKTDAKEQNASAEKKEIYNDLYNWRYPKRDQGLDWWIKVGNNYFRFDIEKEILEIRR